MKVLLCHPGAVNSVHDVFVGYEAALRMAGVDVSVYSLDARIGIAESWLKTMWRRRGKRPEEKPDWFDTLYWAGRDLRDMAEIRNVDWVLIISSMYLSPDALLSMRRAGIRTAVMFTESPYDDEQQARVAELVDVCWTNERTSVKALSKANPSTSYLRAAYDPTWHFPLAQVNTGVLSHDVVFVGSGFQERIDLLSEIDWSGIDLGLYGIWELLPSRHRLRKHVRGKIISNDQSAALYRQAKIGLNLYRTCHQFAKTTTHIERADSMNPRAYELAACGVFQISDRRAEVVETFAGAVPTFRTPEQLEELIRHYLSDHDERRGKLAATARRVIQPHTFAARAEQILADLDAYQARPIAKGA